MKGFTQREGIHFSATFAPVARLSTVRALLAISAQAGLKLEQLDFTCAYLHSDLKEDIWCHPPEGVTCKPGFAWKLNKCVYGLKQSGREWYRTLDAALRSCGFRRTQADPCLYIRVNAAEPTQFIILLVYVDDVILAHNWGPASLKLKATLQKHFNVKDLGPLRWFLGMLVEQDHANGTISISQGRYIKNVLSRFGFEGAKPVSTPGNPAKKYTNLQPQELSPEEKKDVADFPYRSVVGSLLYAACTTRPDIAAIVGFLSRAMSDPQPVHVEGAKRCLRYLKGTIGYKIVYQKTQKGAPLTGFADSNWAGDENLCSTSGYVFTFAGGPVSWKSFKQRSHALSSCEAEYYAASLAVAEALWLRLLFAELQAVCKDATVIREDNTGCIRLSKDPCAHTKSKHIHIRHHFIRDHVESGEVTLEYIKTAENIADMFTKVLGRVRFQALVSLLLVADHE